MGQQDQSMISKKSKKYDKLRPDYERYVNDLKYIEKKNKKLEKEYENPVANLKTLKNLQNNK